MATYYAVVTDTYWPASPASAPSAPEAAPPVAVTDTGMENLGVDEGETLEQSSVATAWFALAWFVVTLSFQLCCPLEYQPVRWHVPYWLMPWLPSAAIALVLFS